MEHRQVRTPHFLQFTPLSNPELSVYLSNTHQTTPSSNSSTTRLLLVASPIPHHQRPALRPTNSNSTTHHPQVVPHLNSTSPHRPTTPSSTSLLQAAAHRPRAPMVHRALAHTQGWRPLLNSSRCHPSSNHHHNRGTYKPVSRNSRAQGVHRQTMLAHSTVGATGSAIGIPIQSSPSNWQSDVP